MNNFWTKREFIKANQTLLRKCFNWTINRIRHAFLNAFFILANMHFCKLDSKDGDGHYEKFGSGFSWFIRFWINQVWINPAEKILGKSELDPGPILIRFMHIFLSVSISQKIHPQQLFWNRNLYNIKLNSCWNFRSNSWNSWNRSVQ